MNHSGNLLNLAFNALKENNKGMAVTHMDQADFVLSNAATISPEEIGTALQLASLYYNIQQPDKSLSLITKMLHLAPSNIDLLRGRAIILRGMGKAQEAASQLESIVQNNQRDVASITILANIYQFSLGDRAKAAHYYELAYITAPDDLELLQSYCASLTANGGGANLTKAYQLAQKILSISPSIESVAEVLQSLSLKVLDYDMYEKIADKKGLTDRWLNQLNMSPFLFRMGRVKTLDDRLELVKNHRAYGTKMESISKLKPINKTTHVNKKVRIGLLSSDLRNHPVAYFVWPIIKHLDRSRFEIYCYSCYPYAADHMQSNIAQAVDSFKLYPSAHSHTIAQAISDDQVDILFELGGPTSFGRSDICTYRPAPIQIAWLGYPHSIGFPTTMDYIMLDPYINPATPGLIIEKPFIMPHTWVALDPTTFPSTAINSIIPEDRNGYITLGTLNAPYKITDEAFKVWAQIMHMFPGSRFLYGRFEADSSALQQNFIKHMLSYGISADRVSFASTRVNHLSCYNNIDIAVDTFPHTGGTTTCEALWMGVPVVTLVGQAFFERISYSNLNNSGLADLCAFSVDEYKNKIIELINNKQRRQHLRCNLRQQIMQHPLGQAEKFTEDFANKIIELLGER